MTYSKFFEEDPFGKKTKVSQNLKKFMESRNLISPEINTDVNVVEGVAGTKGFLGDMAVGAVTGAAGGLAERYTQDK